jgi:alcohol dehydrogenase class IV
LTIDLPIKLTVASGVDAFDHLIESLMSLKFDSKNLDLCNKGMESIWYSLPNLFKNKNDLKERTNMLIGSGIAGKAIHFTGCGICHCIAHTLGSLTKVPHGIAVAYGLFHTIEPVLKNNDDLPKRFGGPFKNLSGTFLAKNIQDWLSSMLINYDIIEKKINFEKFIKIYYLDDNKSMRDNTYYQPSKPDLKILLKSLWN